MALELLQLLIWIDLAGVSFQLTIKAGKICSKILIIFVIWSL